MIVPPDCQAGIRQITTHRSPEVRAFVQVVESKNWNFYIFFNLLWHDELRQRQPRKAGDFSHQKRKLGQL